MYFEQSNSFLHGSLSASRGNTETWIGSNYLLIETYTVTDVPDMCIIFGGIPRENVLLFE